jgi:hypothetical protein
MRPRPPDEVRRDLPPKRRFADVEIALRASHPIWEAGTGEHGDGDRSGLKVGLGLGEDMLEAPARGSCPPDRARLDERRAGVAA